MKDGYSNWCKACDAAKHRRYKDNNPDKVRERHKLYRQKNPDKVREQSARYYQKNRDKLKGRNSAPEKQLYFYKNRAAKKGQVWSLSDVQALELFSLPCRYCGGKGGGIDRVDSSRGYTPDNSVPCCKWCNYMKNEMPVSDFIAHVGRIVANFARLELFQKQEVDK